MAKTSGVSLTTLSIDDSGGSPIDLRNDFTSFDHDITVALQDVTGLDKAALERLQLLQDYVMNLNGVVNTAAGLSHDAFKSLINVRTVSFGHASVTLANECLLSNYAMNRPQSGELTFTTTLSLADGTTPAWGP